MRIRKKKTWDRLGPPTFVFLILLAPFLYWNKLAAYIGFDPGDQTALVLYYMLGIMVCLFLAYALNTIINILVWEGYFEKRLGQPVPMLLKSVISAIIFVAAVAGIVGVVFEKSLTFIIATAGGLSVIVGFAVKDMFTDFFAGVALNLERPFKVGDFIALDSEGEGFVVEMNWRSTHIRGWDNRVTIIPNSLVSSRMLTNYYKAGNYFRGMFDFYIDFEVPPERALRILNAAVKNVQQQIIDITDEYPNPLRGKDLESDAITLGITEFGIKYRVRYWVANYPDMVSVRNKIVINVMQQLKQAGITPVFLRQDFVATPQPEEHLDATAMKLKLLGKIDFLASLQKAELNNLANNLKERNFMGGESIVTQGDPGDSMFIIAEGLVYVNVYFVEEEESVKMSQLTAGNFFGEMCLLTGEPRAATIAAATDVLLYEITKDTMAELLQNRPVIAGKISEIIAKYRKSTQEVKEKLAFSEQEEDSGNLTAQLLGKIKHFFGID